MNFDLDDAQTALQQAVDRCLAEQLDRRRLLAVVDSPDGQDAALWRTLGDIGVPGVMIPAAYGGAGLGLLDAAVVAEVLGSHAAPGPFLGHLLAALAIARGGSEAQRERWLPRLAGGECIGTVALGEADGCWQPEQWRLAGGARLHGDKRNVLYPAQADLLVVGVQGGALMLVEKREDTVDIRQLPALDATRRIAHVSFRGAVAEPLALDGGLLRDAALVLLAADAFGGARRCLDMAVEYALTREQFGRPIGSFQALKHQLADMAVDVEPARALYWYAAHAFDAELAEAPRMAALAKAHITDRFVDAARDATEAHGGIGYTWEYPLHLWLKRALFDRMYLGSPIDHRQRGAALAGWAA